MRVTVRIATADSTRAVGILVRHSAGTVLPDNTFVLSEGAVDALANAGIRYEELAREPGEPVQRTVPGGRFRLI